MWGQYQVKLGFHMRTLRSCPQRLMVETPEKLDPGWENSTIGVTALSKAVKTWGQAFD